MPSCSHNAILAGMIHHHRPDPPIHLHSQLVTQQSLSQRNSSPDVWVLGACTWARPALLDRPSRATDGAIPVTVIRHRALPQAFRQAFVTARGRRHTRLTRARSGPARRLPAPTVHHRCCSAGVHQPRCQTSCPVICQQSAPSRPGLYEFIPGPGVKIILADPRPAGTARLPIAGHASSSRFLVAAVTFRGRHMSWILTDCPVVWTCPRSPREQFLSCPHHARFRGLRGHGAVRKARLGAAPGVEQDVLRRHRSPIPPGTPVTL